MLPIVEKIGRNNIKNKRDLLELGNKREISSIQSTSSTLDWAAATSRNRRDSTNGNNNNGGDTHRSYVNNNSTEESVIVNTRRARLLIQNFLFVR